MCASVVGTKLSRTPKYYCKTYCKRRPTLIHLRKMSVPSKFKKPYPHYPYLSIKSNDGITQNRIVGIIYAQASTKDGSFEQIWQLIERSDLRIYNYSKHCWFYLIFDFFVCFFLKFFYTCFVVYWISTLVCICLHSFFSCQSFSNTFFFRVE